MLIRILPFLLLSVYAAAQPATKNYEYNNGQWFNGKEFVAATWYVSKGLLTQKKPAQIDSVIDLQNLWVIPPMADAHCLSVADNPDAARQIAAYFEEGVYYLQTLNHTQEGKKSVAPLLNKCDAPDAVFSNGTITCTLGDPFTTYESAAWGVRSLEMIAKRYEQVRLNRKMLRDAYWFVDNKKGLSEEWPKIAAGRPGVISISLLDAANSGGKEGKGLSVAMAKAVVKKARKGKLQVFAHVETVEDLRLAVQIGVDGLANLPGYNLSDLSDRSKYELTPADIALLAKKKTIVVPILFQGQSIQNSAEASARHQKLLDQMFSAGVNVAVGSNDIQRTIRTECNYWAILGNLNTAAALKAVCETGPRAIYPKRKIGRIAEGYEASFLVLKGNPLKDFFRLRSILFKVKNGVALKGGA